MSVDLYKDDFSKLGDAEVWQAIEAFTRIAEPLDARPREGYILDFKAEWGITALHTVAGFAHTFGGLLIVGVSEKDAQPNELIGVETSGELKTSIASSIATNISPTPPYEIVECKHPAKAGRKLAVVRVKQGQQLFYLTKKGEKHPIYVRNEDQSAPADAAQLRSLIERKTQQSSTQSLTDHRLVNLRTSINLKRTAELEGTNRVPTHLNVVLAPLDHPGITLDSDVEQQFRILTSRAFRFLYANKEVEKQEQSYIDFYDWRWFCPNEKHETVWRITSNGDIVFASQIRVNLGEEMLWSLGDVIVNLLVILVLARAFWRKTANFFGDAQFMVNLNPQNLRLAPMFTLDISPRAGWPYSVGMFNSDLHDSLIPQNSVQEQSPTTFTLAVFNSGRSYGDDGEIIASVVNQLLRGLGHSANLSALKSTIEQLIQTLSS